MIRTPLTPRPDWRAAVEGEGLIWHGGEGAPYWDESACYRFTAAQVDVLEAATAELYRLFVAAGDRIVRDPDLLARLGIPRAFHQAVVHAWENEPPALNYGRFDLGYDGQGAPKLFEFNCDTPTALLEAAVIQWSWKEAVFPHLDQYNSLHDKLVARWQALRDRLPPTVHFAHVADDSGEDAVTIAYLRDTAERAGLVSAPILIDDIGWDARIDRFVDQDDRPIDALFKLYPWEWLVDEGFAPHLLHDLKRGGTAWLEPVWKMLWSNKGILPILWEMFPDHPNLLGAAWEPPEDADAVAKPLLAREGANVSIRLGGTVVAEAEGGYGDGAYVYQQYYALPEPVPGAFPVIGSWVVDGEPAGIGIREDGRITGNTARFVPHVIEG